MFGIFAPKCPVDLYQKVWVEWRWRWLGEHLDWRVMLNTPVYVPEHIPGFGNSHLSAEDAEMVFRFVAGTMEIDPESIRLNVVPLESLPDNAIGLYELRGQSSNATDDPNVSQIYLAESELDDPISAVSTIAHELAHEVLLGGELVQVDDPDHEWLTDLVPVFYGYGLFLANNTIRESNYNDSGWSIQEMSRKGYLPSHMFGHALAMFAWLRSESKPEWARHLRLDARKSCASSLRYFQKTGDALVHPDQVFADPRSRQSETYLAYEEMSPTHRLGLLWDLESRDPSGQLAIATATRMLQDAEEAIREQALNFFFGLDELSPDSVEALKRVVFLDDDPLPSIRSLTILCEHDAAPVEAFDVLERFLRNSDPKITFAAAYPAGKMAEKGLQPRDEQAFSSTIIRTIDKAFRLGHDQLAADLHPALLRIKNLHHQLNEEFQDWDEERVSELIEFSTAEISAPDVDVGKSMLSRFQ